MSDEALITIPLPKEDGKITYAVARLVYEGERPFAEAIVAIPETVFAPPRRIALSPHGLSRVRSGSIGRPALHVYEGMILPPKGSR